MPLRLTVNKIERMGSIMDSKVICSYKDWCYIEHNGKTYLICFDDMEVIEVEEVARLNLKGDETEEELLNGTLINVPFDSNGELDCGGIYCYWREVA